MRKWNIGILILVLILATSGLSGCSKTNALLLSGTIEATQIDINSEASGKIAEILFDEGSLVHKGDVIAMVDSKSYEIQVDSAKAAVKSAKAKLEELRVGSREEQIRSAAATVKTAKARLDEIKSGSRAEQIAAAEATVKSAKAKLDEATSGARPEAIAQAEAVYKQAVDAAGSAQKNYDYRLDNLNEYRELYKSGAVSKQQVDDAQNAFDLANQKLTNAKDQVEIAKTQLDQQKNGSTAEQIRAAQGNYEQASAQLALLQSGSTKEAIAAAEGSYEQAVAGLDLLKKGSTKQAIDAAEANVEQLQAALDSASLAVEKCAIKTPIDGIILSKTIDVGQMVNVGSTVISVQENDNYWIRVFVPQKDNGRVKLNQNVTITTSALPNTNINGTIVFKSPKAEFTPKNIETTEAKENDTVIAIKVKINDHIADLSAGMIASVVLG